jgi:hypothetical protein
MAKKNRNLGIAQNIGPQRSGVGTEDHVLMRSGQRAQCVNEVPVYVEKTQNMWF